MLVIASAAAEDTLSLSRSAPKRPATIMANPDRRELSSVLVMVMVSSFGGTGFSTVWGGAGAGAGAGGAQKPSIGAAGVFWWGAFLVLHCLSLCTLCGKGAGGAV